MFRLGLRFNFGMRLRLKLVRLKVNSHTETVPTCRNAIFELIQLNRIRRSSTIVNEHPATTSDFVDRRGES